MKSIRFYWEKYHILSCFVKSLLTAYALTVTFHLPLQTEAYESVLDFYIASIYEFLGSYDLKYVLLLVLCVFFYCYLEHRHSELTLFSGKAATALSLFFSLCLLLGQSYYETNSWGYCFGSILNFIKFVLALTGYSLLFYGIILLLGNYFRTREFTSPQEHFFTNKAFLKAFFIIFGSWAPFLLLSYPGNLCWDAIGQIVQVIGTNGYSTHHPLFHTLLMGGLTKLGQTMFGSYEIGLYIYVLLQAAALAAALAATIAVLSKRKAKLPLLLALLLIYCLTPVYSNMASTAVKDVPYSTAVIGYVICLALLLESPSKIADVKFMILFFLLQFCVILLRNNGIYVILLSGVGACCFLFRKYDLRKRVRCLLFVFVGSIAAAELFSLILVQALGAAPGSKREILSLPFQQTARYLQLYRDELNPKEQAAIEAILDSVDDLIEEYDPESADLVKLKYQEDSSFEDLTAYVSVWFQQFLKHPGVYAEAFFVHVYGWFDPAVSNSIRYETDYDQIRQEGLFPNASKILIFYYRFAGRVSPLAVFENVGAAVWALFFLAFYQKRTGKGAIGRAGLPLWISLFICIASPGFMNHPRYAFPIMFTIPFLYGFTLTGHSEERLTPHQKG